MPFLRSFQNRSGVTLVELLVAVTILAVACLSLIASFGLIQRSLQNSKNKTLAANLAQEKMQTLKQKNYYQVLVTTDPSYDTNFTPSVPYDTGYFPVEHPLLEGSVQFTRYTYIQVAKEDSGNIVTLPPSTPDTGLKLITVTVTWNHGGTRKKLVTSSVLGNPDTVTANSIFTGTVSNSATTNPIEGALVNAAENMGWRDLSNASGIYTINLSPGVFNLVASAKGYFRKFETVSVSAEASVTVDFALDPMDTGSIEGWAWYNPDLVISQVVAASNTVVGDLTSKDIEYIVLFNPTGSAVNIGETGLSTNKTYNIRYLDEDSLQDHEDSDFGLTHVSSHVPSLHSYLIANASFFWLDGAWRTADAYYQPTSVACGGALYCDVIRHDRAGAIELKLVSTGEDVDVVGWDDNDNGAPSKEDNAINLGTTDGIGAGGQVVRISSPTDSPTALELKNLGNAYDSGDNSDDFSHRVAVDIAPRSTADGAQTIIAGVPALGALVSVSDGLSDATTAYNDTSPPVAYFKVTNIATGTWTAVIAKDNHGLERSTIALTVSGANFVFPSSTTFLNQTITGGFISGDVVDALGSPISPSITVSPGIAGNDQSTDAGGFFFLRVTSGTVDVTANPGNANADYLSQTVSVPVDQGEIVSDVDFVLTQGGRITGFVTRDGINALPGVAIAMKDSNDYAVDQQVSDINGSFTSINVATGTYTVEPALDSIETSSPTSVSVSVTVGATINAGTFTITGALGTISGSVTDSGEAISTGVLIVVSPSALSGTPPAMVDISSATLSGSPYYMVSSLEDGTYSVDVRSGSYLVYAYYTTISKSGQVTINSLNLSNINVTSGLETAGHNFAW